MAANKANKKRKSILKTKKNKSGRKNSSSASKVSFKQVKSKSSKTSQTSKTKLKRSKNARASSTSVRSKSKSTSKLSKKKKSTTKLRAPRLKTVILENKTNQKDYELKFTYKDKKASTTSLSSVKNPSSLSINKLKKFFKIKNPSKKNDTKSKKSGSGSQKSAISISDEDKISLMIAQWCCANQNSKGHSVEEIFVGVKESYGVKIDEKSLKKSIVKMVRSGLCSAYDYEDVRLNGVKKATAVEF